ncbi:hypothetical protein ACLI1A_08090 [Flavobacterium sp. RHBU_3]|uniref:hypothetical protein n=1 Tax=Flavobacterium sp. RHBU_3 TaxID=3391184 RepID=UPI0039855500
MKKIMIVMAACSAIALSCSKSDDGNGGGSATEVSLSAPANNTECLTGTDVSATQNKVTLSWEAIDGTEKYFVYIKNLSDQTLLQNNAGTTNSYEATLTKGTPYSWYVVAKKASGESVTSPTWKFYNAGTAITSHAPFPADVVAPAMSSTVGTGTVTLQWSGADVDNDIAGYDIYMDTTTNPSTLKGTITQSQMSVTVTAGTYYWKIVTKDQAGNSTASPVYQFKAN